MRFRIDLSYDGTGFRGWANQPGHRTVQGEIEAAITMIMRLPESATLTVAGRTDSGVHARGQVAHVDLDGIEPHILERRLRRLLADDIQVRKVTAAPDGFDARFAALERRYVFRIVDGQTGPDPLVRHSVVHWQRHLDVDRMNAAASHLLGHHDFAAFCRRREGATTIRTLRELSTVRVGDTLETTVRADAFCHSMVRALMGVLVAVGEGRFQPAWASDVLSNVARDSRVTVMPPHGLVLEEVVYPSTEEMGIRAAESRRRRGVPTESRLRLVDLPLPVLVALRDGDVRAAESKIGLEIPEDFSEQVDVWTFMVNLLDGHPEHQGWTMQALALDDEIVGNAGFKGAPDRGGEVEIGYGIRGSHRRRGHALGAVRLLLKRAAREPDVTSICAVIDPDNAASIAVITRSGFEPAGDRIHERWGRQLIFRRTPPGTEPVRD